MIVLCPMTLKEANKVILRWHSHHKPLGDGHYRWAIGAWQAEELVGVAVIGNPVAQALNNGVTLEVTRLCTDGVRNAASRLLGGGWRSAEGMGCRRMISYTRTDEDGVCYRAAGWVATAIVKADGWDHNAKMWLPGFYEPSTEIVGRIRWEIGPDIAKSRVKRVDGVWRYVKDENREGE